jgi:uncharacterized protein YodC (DUF2158 family)
MADFKIGDTVVLKSGSPIMTVEKVRAAVDSGKIKTDASISCIWFDGTKKLDSSFPPDTLEIYNSDDESLIMVVG